MTQKKDLKQIQLKVDELLARMSPEEKIAQLQGIWYHELQTKGVLDDQKVATRLKHGIGQITRIGGSATHPPAEAAKIHNRLQRFLKEETRLGIPAIDHEECCVGAMFPGASIFPQIIGLASTFQPGLAKEMTCAIRRQMLAIGAREGLAPVLDVARDPRWGRVEETFGEDPTLVAQFGVEYVRGLQGEDLSQGVMATGKHFVGHSFSQGGLNCGPVHLGWRDLWNVYLAPFQAAIQDAGLATMMNAYPEIDGELVASSRRILTDLLRDQLGFDGPVVSDYEAVMMIHTYHNVATSRREAAVLALNAGIDVELPTVACYGEDLLEALKAGELKQETVDLAVKRHLQKKFELGLFDNPYVDEEHVLDVFDTAEDRRLAYDIACKSLVLLKNDGLLPIKDSSLKLAVIGPNADSSRCMMGDYSFAAVAELSKVLPDEDSPFESLTVDDLKDLTVSVPTFLDVMKSRFPASQIQYAMGCEVNSQDESGFADALKATQGSDIAILVMGGKSGLAPDCTTGEFRDASHLGLPGVQDKLVKAILATGRPVVLVLIDGRPVSMPELTDTVPAILEAWVPGEEGARAIADVLFGDVNPSGKLPISIPRSAGQVPVFYNHQPSGMHSNIYGDYFNESVTPLFAFGHGLSYAKFEYSALKIDPQQAHRGEVVNISLTIKNTGDCTGDEVVQLYIRDDYASLPRPVKELKGFARVSLNAGESKQVTFQLPVDQMAFYDVDLKLVLERGSFMVMLGSSSADIRLQGEYQVIGEKSSEIKQRIFTCPVTIKPGSGV
ncbi:MAG: glycoside hydrolase family 3 C-terminal domain-containing protein [Anaerolineaceae bacterium]|nr:glycoside hydrolase family 3 C-terminal domain-containing protein [Anaerolineaceae bacterium]MBN2677006.1 glycoside hydrolase family 3 C-terminal domain-containing protein [Anaerolineaceae bacterium]